MQLDVTPCSAPSSATTLDRPSRPCFALTYAALYADARSPCTEEILMTRPQPRAYIVGRAARINRKGASSMMRRMNENRSGGNCSIGATCCRPALFTRMSTSRASSATASMSDRSRTIGSPPTSCATDAARRSSMSSTMTAACAAARRIAHARPMPLPAPVTSARRPARSSMGAITTPILPGDECSPHASCSARSEPRRAATSSSRSVRTSSALR